MSEFKREIRYTVIKHNQLTESQMQYLKNCIFGEGIPTVEAVVIESDWPEFEPVWRMIEDRVSGAPVEGGKSEYDALAAAMTANQTIDGVPRELLEVVARFVSSQADAFPLINVPRGLRSEALDQVARELRALLDAPAKEQQWVSVEAFNRVSSELEELKATQSQGEPVAYRWRVKGQGEWTASVCKVEFDARANDDRFVAQALYAEQPAPVAVVLPDSKAVAALVTMAARHADLTAGANYHTAASFAADAVIYEITRLNKPTEKGD